MVVELPLQMAAVPLTADVGLAFTLNVTFCVNEPEQFGVALMVVIPVTCNICPLLAPVRLAEVKLAAPPALATTPVTGVWADPFIE